MTVAKAGSKWRAYIYDGGTAIATRTFDNPVDARAWERRMKRQLAAGIDVVGAVKKVQEWLPLFLEHRREVVAASTLQRDEGVCSSLPAWLRAHRVCDVNPQVISRLIKSINGSPGTKQRALITVAAFFSWLEGLAVVDRNPVRGIRIPRTNAIGAATNPFSWREVEKMAPEGPYGDVIIVLAYTGLRWGELRALRARDVVIDDDGIATALRVRRSASDGFPEKAPKSGKVRKVPLMQRPALIISRRLRGLKPDDIVFTSPRGGPLNRSNMRRSVRWDEISGGRRIHDLRHTAACEWLRKGVDVATVSAWLGHASVTTTGAYLHLVSTDEERRLVTMLDERSAKP